MRKSSSSNLMSKILKQLNLKVFSECFLITGLCDKHYGEVKYNSTLKKLKI